MSKKKPRKKNSSHKKNGGYKVFIKDLIDTLTVLDFPFNMEEISNKYMRMMYERRIQIPNPSAANILVTNQELKKITQKAKAYYKEVNIELDNKKCSIYQMMLLHCFFSTRVKMAQKDLGEDDTTAKQMKRISDELFKTFYSRYIIGYFRVITQLGNPDFKYFGINIRPAAVFKENPCMELVTTIYGIPAQKKTIKINNHFRPTFRLGKAVANTPIEWIQTETHILGEAYSGQKQKIDVYIQSHALKRLSQRLDLLNKEAINYVLWNNTHTINNFLTYKGYLLLPFKLYGIKVGYLLADIIEDKLLFKTFLFITHNFTPEGDKLREISGLGKQDISYWKIDRLSTFINLSPDNSSAIIELFKNSNLDKLFELKEKEFDIDNIQSVNLNELIDYINRGQNTEKIQQEESIHFFNQ